ncbi:MAG: hypothetical protein RIT27_351 [Pseudomonadota bacterium]|jgi:hypothetical protein
MIDKATLPRPWYKEFYVWMILFFPFSAMVVGFTMLRISWVTFDGLVVDDYYKKGLEINRSLERDHAALKYGLDGYLQINAQTGYIRLFLKANDDYKLPSQLKLNLLHRTRKGLDQNITLQLENGVYVGTSSALQMGLWQVQLEGADWRLDSSVDGKVSEVRFSASENFHQNPLKKP